MHMNIPATLDSIFFSGSLEEDWNVYGQTDDGRQVMAIAHLTLRSGELKIVLTFKLTMIIILITVYQ